MKINISSFRQLFNLKFKKTEHFVVVKVLISFPPILLTQMTPSPVRTSPSEILNQSIRSEVSEFSELSFSVKVVSSRNTKSTSNLINHSAAVAAVLAMSPDSITPRSDISADIDVHVGADHSLSPSRSLKGCTKMNRNLSMSNKGDGRSRSRSRSGSRSGGSDNDSRMKLIRGPVSTAARGKGGVIVRVLAGGKGRNVANLSPGSDISNGKVVQMDIEVESPELSDKDSLTDRDVSTKRSVVYQNEDDSRIKKNENVVNEKNRTACSTIDTRAVTKDVFNVQKNKIKDKGKDRNKEERKINTSHSSDADTPVRGAYGNFRSIDEDGSENDDGHLVDLKGKNGYEQRDRRISNVQRNIKKEKKRVSINSGSDNDSIEDVDILSDFGFDDEFSSGFDEWSEQQIDLVSPFIFSPDFVPDCYLDPEVFEKVLNLDADDMDFVPVKNTENMQYSAEVAAEYEKLYEEMEDLMSGQRIGYEAGGDGVNYNDDVFGGDDDDDDDDESEESENSDSSNNNSDNRDRDGDVGCDRKRSHTMEDKEKEKEKERRGGGVGGKEVVTTTTELRNGAKVPTGQMKVAGPYAVRDSRSGSAGEAYGIYDYSVTVDIAGNRQIQGLEEGQGPRHGAVGPVIRTRVSSPINTSRLLIDHSAEKYNEEDNNISAESARKNKERIDLRMSLKEKVCSVTDDVLEKMDAPDLIEWFQRTVDSNPSEDLLSNNFEIQKPCDTSEKENKKKNMMMKNLNEDDITSNSNHKSGVDRGPSTDDSVLSVFSQDEIDSIHYNSLAVVQQQSDLVPDSSPISNKDAGDLGPNGGNNNGDLGPAVFTLPKRVWVTRTVDFTGVVEDLSQALNTEELRTVGRKKKNDKEIDNDSENENGIGRLKTRNEKNEELNTKISKVLKLRKSLESSLGISAFEEAVMFLRSVAGVEVESSDDDDYLLSEMEEIVGADGLKYLDKLYALITLEEEIDIDYDHIDD